MRGAEPALSPARHRRPGRGTAAHAGAGRRGAGRGRFTATVTQACIVTLEPVEQQMAESLAFRLLPPEQEEADGPEDLDEIACPDGVADLGEAVAEQLALALDPYPRAPGADCRRKRRMARPAPSPPWRRCGGRNDRHLRPRNRGGKHGNLRAGGRVLQRRAPVESR
ncbi:DUF177 domain-containing protein [Siccirubricoccus deserti]